MEGERTCLLPVTGISSTPTESSLDLGVSIVAAGLCARWIKDEVQDMQAQPYLKFHPVLKRFAEL